MARLANVAVGGKVTAAVENADRAGINRTQQLMVPTSAVNGTVGTYGAVTFSAVSSVSLNGCFTSEFDWYRVVFDVETGSSANISAVLRLAGTDAVTGYDYQRQSGANTTNSVSQGLNGSSWFFTITSMAGRHSGTVDLFRPALADETTGVVAAGGSAASMTSGAGSIYQAFLNHRTTTAYDGLTLMPGSGNFSGTIRVYGII